MKSITIKNESCWGPIGDDFSEKGFSIIFSDEFEDASIYDLSSDEDERSKKIPKKDAELFWNEIMKCDFQKVLLENEQWQGCDGWNSIIELSVGLQTVTLSLWCPNQEFYKEQNLNESLKLIENIHNLMEYAARNQVAVGFEF